MKLIPKHRLEQAERLIREKFTFEYFSQLPKYQGLTPEKYEELLNSLKILVFLAVNHYLSGITPTEL